jgi:hypothetical protein
VRPADPRILDAAIELLVDGGATGVFQVLGDSMLPTLAPGAEVRVVAATRPPRFGDLLLFRQADYLAVHRFLGTASDRDGATCFRTRGDGRIGLDPPLYLAGIRGRVVALSRAGGWRSVEGGGARAYAVAVALHDLTWAAAGVWLARLDARLGGRERGGALHSAAAAFDRALLTVADRLLFRLLHRATARPGVRGEPALGG